MSIKIDSVGKPKFDISFGNRSRKPRVYVAVGAEGILHSDDGLNWEKSNLGIDTFIGGDSWGGVCYANNKFLAVTNNSTFLQTKVAESIDGILWTTITLPIKTQFFSACYSPRLSMYVIAGSAAIYTSYDGITWTSRIPSNTQSTFNRVIWVDSISLFVAVGGAANPTTGSIMTSPDGITWTLRTKPNGSNLSDVVYAKGKFVAVGGNFVVDSLLRVFTSPDGIVWTAQTTSIINIWRGITYTPIADKFIASSEGIVNSHNSSDGITWSDISTGLPGSALSICFGDGKVVTVGYNVPPLKSAVSIDGISWTLGEEIPFGITSVCSSKP